MSALGHVYFIRSREHLKIGYSKGDVLLRWKQHLGQFRFGTLCFLGCLEGPPELELELQRKLALRKATAKSKDWFFINEAAIKEIETMKLLSMDEVNFVGEDSEIMECECGHSWFPRKTGGAKRCPDVSPSGESAERWPRDGLHEPQGR
jgi:hypothetical protein